jgi:UTP--glucose-1-phosphate uridylyltransferase|tara:strand:- start:2737 stop:3615 length:879 start_codon:yes stop_codon:yes gene_type:complete
MTLNKVVIPVAGLGTRMLPATKVIPKEMLPIIDKPIIQYVIEECIEAKFSEIILITHSSKNSIENHFDTSFELETALEKRIKKSLLKEIRSISRLKTNIISIRQSEAKGLGHAILQAKNIIGKDPFAVVLPDRVMNKNKCDIKVDNLSLMRRLFLEEGNDIILLEKVLKKDAGNYGIAKIRNDGKRRFIKDIKEKPTPKNAPSNLAVVGRYIFKADILDFIDKNTKKNREIELTDAIRKYINSGAEVQASLLKGECFDCGSKQGYFKSIIETAIYHDEFGQDFKNILKKYSP